jgi:diguanylate cyclase (GGDEF)-like protein
LIDSLTGAYSRGTLDRRLREGIARARRQGEPFSILLADIDHFKSVNDAFGHARGDAVLQELVQRLRAALRASDTVGRYGGDEFAALLPNTSKEQALGLAERVLAAVASAPFGEEPPLSLSSSVGVAEYPADGSTAGDLLERADLRLYEAKRRGRAQAAAEDPPRSASAVMGEPSRLVERDDAIRSLGRFLDEMPRARAGTLAVTGVDGSGRSRMLTEVARAAQRMGYEAMEVRADPALKSSPYEALARAVDPTWGLPHPSDPSAFVEGILRHAEEGATSGVVVAVDELDLLDSESVALLENLLVRPGGPPRAIACSANPEAARRLLPENVPLRESIELEPLTAGGTAVWLRSVLHGEPPEDFTAWLHRETGGLPGYMTRGLCYVLDRGLLNKSEDAWRTSGALYEIPLGERLGLQVAPPPGNLPTSLTSFIGRERETEEVKKLIRQNRLVTLVGPGGVGKTRLALQVAAEMSRRFPGGVWFVPLASLSAGELLPSAIGDALGFRFSSAAEHGEQLVDYLRGKDLLLILDNIEHLLEGMGTLTDVLRGAPLVRIAVTSREPLRVQGECVFEIRGMTLPEGDTEAHARSSAVRLFLDRARKARAGFAMSDVQRPAVTRICRLVDGVPLALELAASWVRALSCEEIAEEIEREVDFLATSLRDLPDRHRSLRAVFESSWELLSAEERDAFAKLSVFRGGFGRDAAGAVAGVSVQMISSLIDKSLLQGAGTGRYHVLEILRQYGAEKLGERASARKDIERLHSEYYAGFVSARTGELSGLRQKQVLAEIGGEIENVRAGWDLAVREGEHELMNRYLAGLVTFYSSQGWVREEETALGSACESLRRRGTLGVEARLVFARVLSAWADACGQLSRYEQAGDLFRDCLGLLDRLEQEDIDAAGLANVRMTRAVSLSRLGWLHRLSGEPRLGRQRTEESLRLLEALTCSPHVEAGLITDVRARTLSNLGMIHWARAEYRSAVGLFRDAIAAYESLGNSRGVAATGVNLGLVHQDLGEYAEAISLYEKALHTFTDLGEKRSASVVSCNLGTTYYTIGDYPRAMEHLRHYLAVSEELGDRRAIARACGNLGVMHHDRGEGDDAVLLYQRALRHAEEIGDRHTAAMLRGNLGVTYTNLGRHREARALLQQAREDLEEIGDKVALIDLLIALSRLCLEDGSGAGTAEEHALAALALSRESGARGAEAKALLSVATVEASRVPTEAAGHFREAIDGLEALGQKRELAAGLLEYGRFLRRTGAGDFREHLSRAAALFKELRLRHKVEEVESEVAASPTTDEESSDS